MRKPQTYLILGLAVVMCASGCTKMKRLWYRVTVGGPNTWVIGDWKEKDGGFKLNVDTKNHFVREVQFQVGNAQDKELPYPTVCHYTMEGAITVVPASDGQKKMYESANKPTPEFVLDLVANKFDLIPGSDNSPKCDVYIERMNKQGFHSNMLVIRHGDGFVDAWDGKTYLLK